MQHFGPPLFHDIDFKRFWRKYHTEYRFNISYKYKCLLLKWVTNWLCNLLEFEKKVTPCTQEYGLTSLVETDQWHCREGLRLYLPKLKEAVIQTIDRLTQRQTDETVFSGSGVKCKNKWIRYNTKSTCLDFTTTDDCLQTEQIQTPHMWCICKQLVVKIKWINNPQQCSIWNQKRQCLTTSFCNET